MPTTTTTLTIGRAAIGGAKVLGSFGKATPGAAALNFGQSGGDNCDTACPYHPGSDSPHAAPDRARCYAATCEARADRKQLAAKLERHERAGADALTAAAFGECANQGFRFPWFRVSSFGSVPAIVPTGFVRLIQKLVDAGTPVHFPIEPGGKIETYREALKGIPVAVRESVACSRDFLTRPGPISFVVGTMRQRPRERVALAIRYAKSRRRRTGRRAVVCPAVAAVHLRTKSKRAKCGGCTACDDPAIDILYPVHR